MERRLVAMTKPRFVKRRVIVRHAIQMFAFAAFLLSATPSIAQREAGREACHAHPTSSCLLDLATAVVPRITDKRLRGGVEASIAIAKAKAGDFDTALAMAHSIAHDRSRNDALLSIAEAQAKGGQSNAARVTIDTVLREANTKNDTSLLSKGIAALVKIGDVDSALAIVNDISDADQRTSELSNISFALAVVGEIDAALAMIERIQDDETRVRTLASIADEWAQVGQTEAARAALNTAQLAARNISNKILRESLSVTAANVQVKAGHFDAALAAAGSIPDAPFRIQALIKIAHLQAEAGQIEDARATLDAVLPEVRKISPRLVRDSLIGAVASTYVKVGLIDASSAILPDIENNMTRASTFVAIARVHLDADRIEAGQANLDLAVLEASGLNTDFMGIFVLRSIAIEQIRAGQIGVALNLIERFAENPYEMARAYVVFAEKLSAE